VAIPRARESGYTIEVERIGAFNWADDSVPINRDPL
jgi:hypothetical protein